MHYPFPESLCPVGSGAETHVDDRFEPIQRPEAALTVPGRMGYVPLTQHTAFEHGSQIIADGGLVHAEQPCDLALCHPDIAIDQSDCNRTRPLVVIGYLNRTEIFYLFLHSQFSLSDYAIGNFSAIFWLRASMSRPILSLVILA